MDNTNHVKDRIIILICILVIALTIFLLLFWMYNIRTITVKPVSFEKVQDLFYKNESEIDNIGDPYVYRANDGNYYCVPTSLSNGFLGFKSKDLTNWEMLENQPYSYNDNYWGSGNFWAPCVVYHNNKYYMYYSATNPSNSKMMISVAVSDKPEGPFIDVKKTPVFDFGYAMIDPEVFIDDDGKIYMYYSRDMSTNKVDGRSESHIYVVELEQDMITAKGEPVLLLKPEQSFETVTGNLRWNEGPAVVKHNGTYYLMYSGGCYNDRSYAVGYATSKSPIGPFTKSESNPILQSYLDAKSSTPLIVSGPGHNSIVYSPDKSEIFAAYHTHTTPLLGGSNRCLNIDRIGFHEDGSMYVNGPTRDWQLKPSGTIKYGISSDGASVSATKGKAGLLTDGDIVVSLSSYEKYGYKVSLDSKEQVKVKIDLKKSKSIRILQIYPLANCGTFRCDLKIGNKRIENIEINSNSSTPGYSVIIPVNNYTASTVTLTFSNETGNSQDLSLGEISVISKK